MSWVAVGVTAAGVVKGSLDAKSARKRQAKNDAFRRAAIQYSPWTGMGDPGSPNVGNTDGLSGALGGGLQGFAMGSTISNAAGAAGGASKAAAAPQSQGMTMNTQGMGGAPKSPWAGMSQGQNQFVPQKNYLA